MRVLDNVGRQVLLGTTRGASTYPLNLQALAAGTYTVLVGGANGQQYAKRLVKE